MAPEYAKDQPNGFKNKIEKVAIVGATGSIGKHFTQHLLKTGKHTITALTRADSPSAAALPAAVHPIPVDYASHASLVSALRGHDFLIITLSPFTDADTHARLASAAADAGIRYAMPNAYTADLSNASLGDRTLFGPAARRNIQEVRDAGLAPLVLSCGFWYEFSLGGGPDRYGVDFAKREMTFVSGGDKKFSTSTWAQCGRAVAALLSLPVLPEDETDERVTLSRFLENDGGIVHISSFLVDQKAMFESVKRVTGTVDADWTILHEEAGERYTEAMAALKAGDHPAFVRVMYTGILFPGDDGNVEDKVKNKLLGLPEEDLDENTKLAIAYFEQEQREKKYDMSERSTYASPVQAKRQ